MKTKILWILTLLPIFITLIAIQFMPDIIPAHYDAMGNIDRWGSKYESFIFPAIIVVCTVHWSLFLRYYSKKQATSTDDKVIKEAKINQKVLYYVAFLMAFLFTIMHCTFMYSSITASKSVDSTIPVDIYVIVNIALAGFYIIIGNIMPKCKMNSVVGLRTCWSMENDITWAKSNRFAGISLMISGVLIIIETVLIGGTMSLYVMFGVIMLNTIISVVYSYHTCKKSLTK